MERRGKLMRINGGGGGAFLRKNRPLNGMCPTEAALGQQPAWAVTDGG